MKSVSSCSGTVRALDLWLGETLTVVHSVGIITGSFTATLFCRWRDWCNGPIAPLSQRTVTQQTHGRHQVQMTLFSPQCCTSDGHPSWLLTFPAVPQQNVPRAFSECVHRRVDDRGRLATGTTAMLCCTSLFICISLFIFKSILTCTTTLVRDYRSQCAGGAGRGGQRVVSWTWRAAAPGQSGGAVAAACGR